MKKKQKVPQFQSLEEAARFWDTHSSADYDLEEADLKVHSDVKKPSDLSPRCPNHKNQVLYSRWRNLMIADGFATLNHVRELYCPRGDYTRLAPETETLVKQAEAALKPVRPKARVAA